MGDEEEAVLFDVDEAGVGTITINRPVSPTSVTPRAGPPHPFCH